MEIASSNNQMVKHNKELSEDKRQSHVLLKFANPIRRSRVKEFFRIHLTPEMHDQGEDDFYRAEILQSHRIKNTGLCKSCGQQMERPSEAWCVCRNKTCKNYGMRDMSGPVRGVVDIKIFPEFVCGTETVTEKLVNGNPFDLITGKITLDEFKNLPSVEVKTPVEFVNQCLLCLDRRYPDFVLAGVYRAAGTICDMNEWAIE